MCFFYLTCILLFSGKITADTIATKLVNHWTDFAASVTYELVKLILQKSIIISSSAVDVVVCHGYLLNKLFVFKLYI
jgi:hypothetical protein